MHLTFTCINPLIANLYSHFFLFPSVWFIILQQIVLTPHSLTHFFNIYFCIDNWLLGKKESNGSID